MISRPRYLLLFSLLLVFQTLSAQLDTLDPVKELKPPKNRELFHDYVDNQQERILKSDGKADEQFTPSRNEEINFYLTKIVGPGGAVDWLQYKIEKDSTQNDQIKKKYLRGLESLLKYFNNNWTRGVIDPIHLPDIVQSYDKSMQLDMAGGSIENIINEQPYDVGLNLLGAGIFEKNPGFRSGQYELLRKYCTQHPDEIFIKLRDNTEVPFFDSLIKLAAYRSPGQLYNFAAASNKLGYAIRKVNDSLVKAVSQMATSTSGRWYFPFLDNIMRGKMTIADIDAVKDDSVKYYRLLVNTRLDYLERAMRKDTAYGYKELENRLITKARDVFVNTINALHDIDNPAVRFKIIQPLTAEELYYLAVSTDGIIYTSSFVKGVYPLMMSKANNRGDSLLMMVKFDKYRKFIKMTAGYNNLSAFLSTFPAKTNAADESNAEKLMRAFVGKLEQTGGLEDGVDVADSYASIVETIKPLADQILLNVKNNYDRNIAGNNKRGIVMYNLLNKLFLSADTNNHIDLSKEFGIPPVYEVPLNAMKNDSGKIIMQVFFYGDKDGIGVFPGFKRLFDPRSWKIVTNKYWITITSLKGVPVTVYANLPLPEETGEDAKAQKELCEYMQKTNQYPTVTVHRGHSYNTPYTIEQMFSSSKIVFLGSCGGYQIIHDALKKAPDAHIIATKQIADAPVNNPFFQLLTEKVRNGNNIDWIPFWKELDAMVTAKIFEDYIPPYKNLGAIFIKAYTKAMGDDE